jgi:undecaprenyl pyrophosphate synthase
MNNQFIKTSDEYKYFYIELTRKHSELEVDEIIEIAEKYTKEFLQTPESKHESSLLQLIYDFIKEKDDEYF